MDQQKTYEKGGEGGGGGSEQSTKSINAKERLNNKNSNECQVTLKNIHALP